MSSCTKFEINLISARDLKRRRFLTTRVYAGVSICGGPEHKTQVDKVNGNSPIWNFKVISPIDDSMLQNFCAKVVIKLYCERPVLGDRCIGQADVALKDLRDRAPSRPEEYLTVKRGSKDKGTLKFSYGFVEPKREPKEEPKAAGNPSHSWIKSAFEGVIAIFNCITCSAAVVAS